jgi:tetratricopeptide (TPR) repeat protein
MPSIHPTDEQLRALSLGLLAETELAGLTAHLDACSACCGRIELMSTDDPLLACLQRGAAHHGEGLITPAQRRPAVLALRQGQAGQTTATTSTLPSPGGAPGSSSPPRQVGDFDLLSEIARGGMGVVYRAADRALGRLVAVKVLQDRYEPDSAAARRFLNEARITAQLQHPGIPPVHEVGTLPDGRPFLAMKLIQGQTLEEQLRGRPDLAADRGRLVAAFEQVCQAVAYAHAHGVIHRDLKPANVMVGSFGEVQVMDWGLAKVLADAERPRSEGDPGETSAAVAVRTPREGEDLETLAGSVLGTPAFMPPEQARGAVDEVDRRSDVFGLGAILAAVLTGLPPFVRPTAEATGGMAARGEVDECFARLDGSGADPGLVALCRRCLAPRREDRPADAGEVAGAVAELRAAAEERARRAELDRVRAEGEMAAAAARSLERRRRRRLWLVAAAAVALAVIGGLSAVLLVQDRARRNLEAKQRQLEDRFEMARKAIAAFHTTVEREKALEAESFRPLRAKLLESAASFYRELEGLLANETDAKSRKALADGYYQLGGLAERISDQQAALAVYQQALAIRRELAALPEPSVDARLDVATAVRAVGRLRLATGDSAGALLAFEEARDLAAALEAEAPTDAVRQTLAHSHLNIGMVLRQTGQPAEALAAYEKARLLYQGLADAHPAGADFQLDLGTLHGSIGTLLSETGKPAPALAAYDRARVIWQRLTDAHPTVTSYQRTLALNQINIGFTLSKSGLLSEALAAYQEARVLLQRLADANPADTQLQSDLGNTQFNIGELLSRTGKQGEALAALERARDITQRLADANPAVTQFQNVLARCQHSIGYVLSETGKPAEALAAYRKALDVQQRLADANPAVTFFQEDLAWTHFDIGNLLRVLDQPGEALTAHAQARAIRQKLADANPTVAKFHLDLSQSQTSIGRLHAQQGRFAKACAALDAAVATLGKWAEYSNDLAFSHASRGWARARSGNSRDAADDLRRAVELWDKDQAPPSEMRFERARALALLAGLAGDSHSGVTAAEAAIFADQAVAALCDALRSGWNEPNELKERDFDALLSRAEFQKLVAEARARSGPKGQPKD